MRLDTGGAGTGGAPSSPGALTLIQRFTLAANGQFTFSAIPQTYQDLKLRIIGRSQDTLVEADTWLLQFNGNTGGSYDMQRLSGADVTAAASVLSGSASWSGNADLPGSATVDIAGFIDIDLFNYTSTTWKHGGVAVSGYADPATAAADQKVLHQILSSRFTPVAAITSLFVSTVGGAAFLAGSIASLYGVS